MTTSSMNWGALITDVEAWELLHPTIQDLCRTYLENAQYEEAAQIAVRVIMDELRRLTNDTGDGDSLIRNAIGIKIGQVSFSENSNNSEKSVTAGLTQILQGLYKGVRSPITHHGFGEMTKISALQILATCSFLLTHMRINYED